jgi:hypothetical protein
MSQDVPFESAPPRPDLPSAGPKEPSTTSGGPPPAWPVPESAVTDRSGASTGAAWSASSGPDERPRRTGRIFVAAATAIAVVAAAVWFVLLRPSGPTGPAVALAVSFPKDHALSYRMSMLLDGKVDAAGQQVDMSVTFDALVSMQHVSTDPSGVTTVLMRMKHVEASANGQTVKTPNVETKIRISPDGRIVDGEGLLPSTGGTTDFLPGSDQFAPLLPDHPVRVGEEWTQDFDRPFPLGSGDIHYSSTSHIDRFEVVQRRRAAVIASDGEISMDGITMDLGKALAVSGSADQLPAGVSPTMSFDGSMQLVQTSWVDTEQDMLLKVQTYGPFDFTVDVEGAPGALTGTIDMAGRLDLSLSRVGGSHKTTDV